MFRISGIIRMFRISGIIRMFRISGISRMFRISIHSYHSLILSFLKNKIILFIPLFLSFLIGFALCE